MTEQTQEKPTRKRRAKSTDESEAPETVDAEQSTDESEAPKRGRKAKADTGGYHAKVKVSILNVRDKPEMQGDVIDTVNYGHDLHIVEDLDEWGKLDNGGYVALDYVEKEL